MADGKKVTSVEDHREINQVTRDYMNLVEARNKARVADLIKTRRRNNITGVGLICLAAGIYVYTIKAVKQERFLDDFEEPKLIEKN